MMTKIKDILLIVLLILLALFGILLYIKGAENEAKNKKIEEHNHLMLVVNDSLHHYKTENGKLGVYKHAFQNDLKTLKENQAILTENQKALFKEVKDSKNIIAAMRTEMVVEIKNLANLKPPVILNDTTMVFTDSTTNISYTITVTGVKPSANARLTINDLEIPDSMTVKHKWDKDGNVIVDVVHTNPYLKVKDVDGYVIPEATQKKVKPKLIDKFKNTIKNSSKVGTVLLVTAAVITVIILL